MLRPLLIPHEKILAVRGLDAGPILLAGLGAGDRRMLVADVRDAELGEPRVNRNFGGRDAGGSVAAWSTSLSGTRRQVARVQADRNRPAHVAHTEGTNTAAPRIRPARRSVSARLASARLYRSVCTLIGTAAASARKSR